MKLSRHLFYVATFSFFAVSRGVHFDPLTAPANQSSLLLPTSYSPTSCFTHTYCIDRSISMALNPLFTVTFDVGSSDNYGGFIADLRNRLANPRHFSHNRPVLPPVEPGVTPPRRWFHVVLRTKTAGALTLATRADNLYLEGFRSSDGTWWELTRGVIPGATYAGFGGSYPDLLRDTARLLDVSLGPQHMTEAVKVLAARTRADLAAPAAAQQRAKDAVVALLLMVHEATRFQTVSGLVAGVMHPKAAMKSAKITAEMKAQVNGWEDLSAALLKTDARPPVQFVGDKGGLTVEKAADAEKNKGGSSLTAETAEKMGVDTVEKAASTVGILLFVEDPKVKNMMTAATAWQLFRGN